MTFAGLDVHARSTHVAALEVASGELKRIRFGQGSEEVTAWLAALPQPVHGCYEAGPTGFALYRAAEQAGLRLDVVAPSKTPRAAGDRIKSDRKDAELLCRLLMAGQLKPVTVPAPALPPPRLEALAVARPRLPGTEHLDAGAPALAFAPALRAASERARLPRLPRGRRRPRRPQAGAR